MPSRRRMPSQEQIEAMCQAVLKYGNKAKAAESLNIPGTTLKRWTKHLHGSPKGGGFNPVHAHKHPERILTPEQIAARRTGDKLDEQAARIQEIKSRKAAEGAGVAHRPGREPIAVDGPAQSNPTDFDKMLATIRKRPSTLDDLSSLGNCTRGAVVDWLDRLKAKGFNVRERAGQFSIDKDVEQSYLGGPSLELFSDSGNIFYIGAMGDTHIGSKYSRIDCLHKMYDRYADEGITSVLHAGNWIEGEARFNKFDLEVHGMDAQLRYLAEQYPRRDGMKTYAVAGDDHEGWYGQQVGANIGKYAENAMRDEGRTDWFDMGYMEAHIKLTNANTGKSATLALVHPGGGSSYALSYTSQKLVECVPLHSEILTPHGWRKHDEIAVGDLVLGYNVESDQCEWTAVRGINRGEAETVRYHNDQFDVTCTPNHRWAIEWESRGGPNPDSRTPKLYSRRERHLWTLGESRDRSRIIHAAPAVDGPGMPKIPHQDWLRRDVAVETVLTMTSGERRAFIEGMLLGEGTVGNTRGYRTVIFSQRPGAVNDAFRLACFLEGIATSDRPTPAGSYKPTGEPFRRVTVLNKRMRNVSSLKIDAAGIQDVWCPTTDLGTWVMRQGDLITITGNSYEGGEKPAVLVAGHYHKLWSGNIRNVWVCQSGCFQDQTPFMRKKRLEAHVGGAILKMRQDPETGAIVEFMPNLVRFFNKAYYSNRWSHSGEVVLPERS